MKNTKGV